MTLNIPPSRKSWSPPVLRTLPPSSPLVEAAARHDERFARHRRTLLEETG